MNSNNDIKYDDNEYKIMNNELLLTSLYYATIDYIELNLRR